jgi:hypothetical protein
VAGPFHFNSSHQGTSEQGQVANHVEQLVARRFEGHPQRNEWALLVEYQGIVQGAAKSQALSAHSFDVSEKAKGSCSCEIPFEGESFSIPGYLLAPDDWMVEVDSARNREGGGWPDPRPLWALAKVQSFVYD